MPTQPEFDSQCVACPRLANFLQQLRGKYPSYHCRPVPAFGVAKPRLLIVGLAPGMHGANRTARPFTGDHAGILLYQTLHQFGLASASESVATGDGLVLYHCRITNAIKCLPPDNKPSSREISTCNRFLQAELNALEPGATILALGRIAHAAVIKAAQLRPSDYLFAHAAQHQLPGGFLLWNSYHCSRYNTQTKRLTATMFQDLFTAIVARLKTETFDTACG